MKSDILAFVWIALSIVLAIWLLVTCFRKVSDWHILKNNKKYFKLNKEICRKNKKRGEAVLEAYVQYMDFIKDFNLNRTIRCSNSIVSGSRNSRIKYLLKYSDIQNSSEDMERLEYISKFLDDYVSFIKAMNKASNEIKNKLPLFYRVFADKRKLPYSVCGLNYYELTNVEYPFLCFLYISPGGKSKNENNIIIDEGIVEALVREISKTVSKKGYAMLQRSAMTNDLREAIKRRDNYTCCNCGNSVYDEPNLLLEVDHIIPISKGGKTELSNLQTLCWRCNRLKSNK